ncbi:MAG: fibronectin type III domain-containing protein, partial [Oligoflexia bacterium]|nr:fibronectin type III domain-containing protein [Oligoflexia bacterium]
SVIPAAAITNSKSVSVEFSASEPASFECSLDGAAAAPCASPFSTLLFNEGNHEVAITAVDAAGNRSDTTRVAWIMDFTLPELSWGPMTPSAASVINSSALRAEILSLESVTLAGTLNLSDLGPISSPLQLSGLPEGAYSLAVIGTDRAGNSSSPLVHEFSVDLTAPVVTLSALHAGGALTTEAINSFEFSANETASFECSLDSAGFSACSSPLNVSGLSDGLHVFEVRATDVAGNVSALASASWQVDRLAPVTTLVPTRTQNASISFAFTVTEPIARFECSLDGQTFAECTPPVAYFGLSVGNHSFAVRAVDLAGNLETPPATYSWIVDPPITTKILSITPAEKYTRSSSISFTFSSNQSGGATFICSRDGEAAGPCVSPVSYTGLASGSHSFVVRAVDSWGSPDPIGASYSWSVDTTPPVVVSFTPTGGSYSVTVNWTTDEPATSKINWGLGSDTSRVVNEDSNYVTSHSVRITGLSASTLYSFIVSGHDRAGNAYVSAKKQVRTY